MLWQFSCENKELQVGEISFLHFNKDSLGFQRVEIILTLWIMSRHLIIMKTIWMYVVFKTQDFNNTYTKEEQSLSFKYFFVVTTPPLFFFFWYYWWPSRVHHWLRNVHAEFEKVGILGPEVFKHVLGVKDLLTKY